MGHLGPRKVYPHNSGSSVGIALQFYTMKGAKRGMEIILLLFLKKILFRQFGYIGLKLVLPHNFGPALRFFFNIAQ